MEKFTKHKVAQHLGLDPVLARGLQDWTPDTHPHLKISELVYGKEGEDAVLHPFRVLDKAAGTRHTRIPEGLPLDHDRVKKVHAEALALNQKKNREVWPLIVAAIPDMEPDGSAVLNLGGKLFDLVEGKLVNPRTPPPIPTFSVSGNQIVVNASDLSDEHQTILKKSD